MELTTKQIDSLEREKLAALQELNQQLITLDTERGQFLVELAAGDEGANKKISAIQKKRDDIKIQIEAIEALLSGIPKKRDLAQADELEAKIQEIEKLDQALSEIAPRIDAAADAFVQVVGEYYENLRALRDIDPQNMNLLGYDIGALDSIGAALRKHGLWEYNIKVGAYRYATTMVEGKSKERNFIAGILFKTRNEIKQLRGES